MSDQYELAELRRAVGNRLGGFYNSFRYAANRALWILPHLSVGQLFKDTLGKFYPFNVNSVGTVQINSSRTSPNFGITFHDTAQAGTGFDVDVYSRGNLGLPRLGLTTTSASRTGWVFDLLDADGSGNTEGFSIQASSASTGNPPLLSVTEKLVNDGAPTAYSRYSRGMFFGGFDATQGTLPVTITTKAGTPIDTDFGQYGTPSNGTIVIDTSANKIWVRIGGSWKSVGVA